MNKTISWSLGNKMFPLPPAEENICCPYCGKHPSEIEEYIECSEEECVSPVEYVKTNEGTYCQFTGLFVCTSCYIRIGMPLNEELHNAFPDYRLNVKPLPEQNNSEIEAFLK